jgi:hypothetical protein
VTGVQASDTVVPGGSAVSTDALSVATDAEPVPVPVELK